MRIKKKWRSCCWHVYGGRKCTTPAWVISVKKKKKKKKHTENSRWRQKSQVMKSSPFMVDRSAVEGDMAIWAISPHWRESGALSVVVYAYKSISGKEKERMMIRLSWRQTRFSTRPSRLVANFCQKSSTTSYVRKEEEGAPGSLVCLLLLICNQKIFREPNSPGVGGEENEVRKKKWRIEWKKKREVAFI